MSDREFSTPIVTDGTATIRVRSRPQTWVVSQVSVELSGLIPAGATCRLRKNGSLITIIVPSGDAASGDPPVVLNAADEMTVEWAGCTPGAIAKAFVIYAEAHP